MTERRLTPRGQQRREQLTAAATRLFAKNGYHGTSVADIVDELGVGKGVFYWYFASKEELLVALLHETTLGLRRAQAQAIAEEPSPLRRIELGIRASVAYWWANRDRYTLFSFAAIDEAFRPALVIGRQTAIDDTAAHLKAGIVAGQVKDLDPLFLAYGIYGVVTQFIAVFLAAQDASPHEVADAAVAFCLDGIRVD